MAENPLNARDDFYITLLKFISHRMTAGQLVSIQEVVEYVQEKHPNVSELAIRRVSFEAVTNVDIGQNLEEKDKSMELEAYFHVLEHAELQEARRTSKNAMFAAIAAMLISASLAFAAIVINLWDVSL